MEARKLENENDARYRALFDRFKHCVVLYRPVRNGQDFLIEDMNQAGQRLEQVRREDVLGRSLTEVLPWAGEFGLLQVLRRVWQTGRPEQFPLKLYVDDRIRGWRDNTVFRVSPGLVAAVYTDAAERRLEEQVEALNRAQAETEQALLAAERANRAKGVFLTNMSHEIRTPLNAILGFAHLIGMGTLDSQQRDHLKGVVSSSENLLRIMSDILDFSRIEAGELRVEQTSFCVDHILDNLSGIFGMAAGSKGLQLLTQIDPDIPCMLEGDPLRIGQVLRNLISNALKFTEQGSVVVSLRAEAAAGRRVQLRFEVADTGIGIPQEGLGRMFDAFSQGDDSTTRRFGGAGLGLAISEQLAGMMGGRLEVDSAPGSGSRFALVLSLPGAETTRRQKLHAEELAGVRVLWVERPGPASDILAGTLESFGMQVEAVADCATARTRLETKDAHYDLLAVGWRRDVRDSAPFVAWIRQARPQLLTLVLNDYGIEQWRKWAPGIGVSAVEAKSVSPQRLFSVIRELFLAQSAGAGAADLATGVANTPRPPQIPPPQLPGFRLDEALARFDGDLGLLQQVLVAFLGRAAAMRAAVAEAAERADAAALREQAHKLRGMAGNISAHRVYAAASELEGCFTRQGADAPAAVHEAAEGLLAALDALDAVRAAVPRQPQRPDAGRKAEAPQARNRLAKALVDHLRRQSIRAEECAEALLQHSSGTPAEAPLERMLNHLRDFDFAAARGCMPEVLGAFEYGNIEEIEE